MSRPSDLTEELTLQIRNLYLKGHNYVEIQELLDIPANTWDTWIYRDTQGNGLSQEGFRTFINKIKVERLVKKAEKLSDEILEMNHYSMKEDSEVINTDLLRVKQKESEFVRETLAKDSYSKKTNTDLTSKGEQIVIPTTINIVKPE